MKIKIICLKILLVLSLMLSCAHAKDMRRFGFNLDKSDFVKENRVVAYFKEINPQNYHHGLCNHIEDSDSESEFVESVDPLFMPAKKPSSIRLLHAIPSIAETKKLMFDSFCEERFLFEQVIDLYGSLFKVSSEEKLIDNAIDFAQKHQVSLGKKLTDEQMELLTESIIWLVEEEIGLPDNNKALVPYLYIVWPNKGQMVVCELSKFGELSCDYDRMVDWVTMHQKKKEKICECYRKCNIGSSENICTHFWNLTHDEAIRFGSSYSDGNNNTFGLRIEVENESACTSKCCYDANGSNYSVDDIYGTINQCPKKIEL